MNNILNVMPIEGEDEYIALGYSDDRNEMADNIFAIRERVPNRNMVVKVKNDIDTDYVFIFHAPDGFARDYILTRGKWLLFKRVGNSYEYEVDNIWSDYAFRKKFCEYL